MRFDVISTFPEFFSVLDLSLVGKARDAGVLDIEVHNLRNWATGKHLSVDDSPSGGGAGMVMRADVDLSVHAPTALAAIQGHTEAAWRSLAQLITALENGKADGALVARLADASLVVVRAAGQDVGAIAIVHLATLAGGRG